MSCLESVTSDISSRVSNHLEYTDFLVQYAKLLDAVSPAVSNSSPEKEVSH